MSTPPPSIDIIIPLYNGEAFIGAALKSVLNQTLLPAKIIVVDDGSTDNGAKLVKEFIAQSLVEILFIPKINNGVSSARNTGIKASTSDYIAFLDADDIWVPEKLSEQIAIFNTTCFNKVGLVYCKYNLINTDGSPNTTDYIVPLDKKIKGSVFKKLLEGNKILSSGSGVLIKRSVFDTVGVFDETLIHGEDWDMWLRIAEQYDVDYSDKVLVHIRRHDNNITHDPQNVFLGELAFINHWAKRLGSPNHIPRYWIDKISFTILRQSPKSHYIELVKNNLSPSLYKHFYRNYFNSVATYTIVFVLRTIIGAVFSSSTRKKILNRL